MTNVGDRVLIVGKHPWAGFTGEVISAVIAGPRSIAYKPGTRVYEVRLDVTGHVCAAEGHEIVAAPRPGVAA
jgi:hypothetical protein